MGKESRRLITLSGELSGKYRETVSPPRAPEDVTAQPTGNVTGEAKRHRNTSGGLLPVTSVPAPRVGLARQYHVSLMAGASRGPEKQELDEARREEWSVDAQR